MVNATKDEYRLPYEVLEDAFGVVEAVQENRVGTQRLSTSEREANLQFGVVLESASREIDVDEIPWPELVHDCVPWARIRVAARECLVALGFDLAQWEKEEDLGNQ